jgi:hypothetical protein
MHSLYAVVTWTRRNLTYIIIIIIIIIIIEIFAINVLRNVQTSSNAKEITSFLISTWNLRGPSVFHVCSSYKTVPLPVANRVCTYVDISRRQAITVHQTSINCFGWIKLICLLITIFIYFFLQFRFPCFTFQCYRVLTSLFFSFHLSYWCYEWLWSSKFTLLQIYLYILASQDIQRIQNKMRHEETSVS